jgi:hypothetical protein
MVSPRCVEQAMLTGTTAGLALLLLLLPLFKGPVPGLPGPTMLLLR